MGNPHRRGVVLAVLAALAFGLATPFVARVSVGVGPSLALYLGGAAPPRRGANGFGDHAHAPDLHHTHGH